MWEYTWVCKQDVTAFVNHYFCCSIYKDLWSSLTVSRVTITRVTIHDITVLQIEGYKRIFSGTWTIEHSLMAPKDLGFWNCNIEYDKKATVGRTTQKEQISLNQNWKDIFLLFGKFTNTTSNKNDTKPESNDTHQHFTPYNHDMNVLFGFYSQFGS
jgi:hypothetical protein